MSLYKAKETNMTTIPTITEEDVLDYVGEGSFQRGQKYFRDNRIFDTRRAGMTLKALLSILATAGL
jgi:uncharacterized Zn finger protein